MRQIVSLVVGAAAAAVGGLVLGEYPFTGWTPYVAGLLFALVVTEVMLSVGRRHGPVLGVGGAALTSAGLGWAVWISSGRGVAPVPSGGWIAIGLGAFVALARGLLPGLRLPAAPAPAGGPPRDRGEPAVAPPAPGEPPPAPPALEEPPAAPPALEEPPAAPPATTRKAAATKKAAAAKKAAPPQVRGAKSRTPRNRADER